MNNFIRSVLSGECPCYPKSDFLSVFVRVLSAVTLSVCGKGYSKVSKTKVILGKLAILGLLAVLAVASPSCVSTAPSRRVEVHLYGGSWDKGALLLAPWYRSVGITDVWLPYPKGAFPVDAGPELQGVYSLDEIKAIGTLDAYRKNHIRYWWFERPVPDYFYEKSKRPDFPKSHLWDSNTDTDALWTDVCNKIKSIYPQVRKAGYSGIVYDSEAYYSYKGDASGKAEKPWLWGGHDDQYGFNGNYYKRGLQMGQAINAVWPKAKMIIAYAFGYDGERWWYQGLNDAGLDFYIGPEHTYGAGPYVNMPELGNEWYQSWWQGRKTKETCDWKRTQFPFIRDNQHVNAGLFPIEFNTKKALYRAKYFREQLAGAANDDPKGPIPVWIWPQGPFTPEGFQAVKYASGETAEDYLNALRDYSQAFSDKE